MRMNRKIIALSGAVALLFGGGAIANGGLWSAQGAASGADHRGWPVSSSRSPAAAVSAAKAAAHREGTKVLTVVEVEDRVADVDVGEPGETPGDYFLFENKLMNEAGTRVVGRDAGRCMLGIRTFECNATAVFFGKGKITVAGAFFSESDTLIAITGGTRTFKEAGGQLSVVDQPDGTTLLVFQVTD